MDGLESLLLDSERHARAVLATSTMTYSRSRDEGGVNEINGSTLL